MVLPLCILQLAIDGLNVFMPFLTMVLLFVLQPVDMGNCLRSYALVSIV